MRTLSPLFAASALCLILLSTGWCMRAGFAEREITPEPGLPMAGFTNRVAEGVLDPLHLRTAVFEGEAGRAAFVVYDLIFPFSEPIGRQVTSMIRERTGIESVIYSATHTHSGPAIHSGAFETDTLISGLPDFERDIISRTVDAVAEAAGSLEPVLLGAARGSTWIAYNRIVEQDRGGVRMKWANHEREPLGPVDPTVTVVRVDDTRGRPVALLVNHACHPVIHGRGDNANPTYSADFPGVLCNRVRSEWESRPLCLFFNGACGNLNPYDAHTMDNPREAIDRAGNALADEVIRLAGKIETVPVEDARVPAVLQDHCAITGRWDTEEWLARNPSPASRRRSSRIADRADKLSIPYSVVMLTPEIGFAGLPGEFFFQFQQRLRQGAPFGELIVAGYTGASYGYFPTVEAAVTGGYGANDPGTWVQPGAGEHLVVEMLVGMHELGGNLRPVPSSGEAAYRD